MNHCRHCGGNIVTEHLVKPNEMRHYCLACGREANHVSQIKPRPEPRRCLKGHVMSGRNLSLRGACISCSRARAVATKPTLKQTRGLHAMMQTPHDPIRLGKEWKGK